MEVFIALLVIAALSLAADWLSDVRTNWPGARERWASFRHRLRAKRPLR